MHNGKFVFAQILEFLPRREFDELVKKYDGNSRVRSFDCRDQFLAMMFGQLAGLSLSGIVLCLNAHSSFLYHLGFKARRLVVSTLSRANENRDWRIYRDFADLLIRKTRKLYADDNDFAIELDGTPYAIDSTLIELCLSTFRWAKFYQGDSGIKIHAQLDLRGNIPSFFLITEAVVRDWDFLDLMEFEKGAYYIMDRGYYDFLRLNRIHQQSAYFIIRAKKNISIKRLYSEKVDKSIGLRSDQTIVLRDRVSRKNYPEKIRRIKYYDQETGRYYIFLTNNFKLPAITVADLYRQRWQVELFFKWIKQHLRVEVFWGTSRNAVKTQICIAISTLLLVATIKKKMNISCNLYEILQILSVSLLAKTPIKSLFPETGLQIIEEHAQEGLFPLDF